MKFWVSFTLFLLTFASMFKLYFNWAFCFTFLFVILLVCFIDGTSEREDFIHQIPLLFAELGSSVILPCSHSDDFINYISWYKHSFGKRPLLMAYSEHKSGSVTYQNGFDKTNRHFIKIGSGSFNLSIIHVEEYDFANYYCAVSFLNIITFGEGTILLPKGELMTIFDCT